MITDVELVENLLKIGNYKKMFRVNYKGLRLYISEDPFKYYSGLTGALSAATFNGSYETKILKGWRENFINTHGKETADAYLNLTADFGTLLHASLVTIKENGKIVWKEEFDKAIQYFTASYKKQEIDPNMNVIRNMAYEYQKHVASLMQFIYDRVDEIYAIETPATWEELGIATPIDMVCSCRQTPKGEFAKTTINLKTSSQISKHQLEQISCELVMWNNTYDKCDYTAILRTKDWKEGKTPSYEYKYLNRVEARELAKDAYGRLSLCKQSDASYYPTPQSKTFQGETVIGKEPEIIIKGFEEEWNEYEKE